MTEEEFDEEYKSKQSVENVKNFFLLIILIVGIVFGTYTCIKL